MKQKLNIEPKSKYVVAVSFGPDSMALLHILISQKANIVVAHVNYHRRPESNYEEEQLRLFCKKTNIPIQVLDTAGLFPEKNFQNWARKIRYEFFKKVLEEEKAKAVLVAHQEDDLIETYIMQKRRGNYVKNWGIAEKNSVFGIDVIRPLLSYSKKELQEYCDSNNVPYSIDSSNLEDHYSRNKIRHSIVEKMSKKDREQILTEIRDLEFKKDNVIFDESMSLDKFLKLSDEEMISFISSFLNARNEHMNLSKGFLNEIRKAFSQDKANVKIKLSKDFYLAKEYDEVFIYSKLDEVKYLLSFNEPARYSDELFDIDFTLNADDRNVFSDSYPIQIRPVSSNDIYYINDYKCQVRRLLIDWKVPPHLRNSWPGIYDKNGKLVYIPRYRKDFVDNHKSKFIIKFTKHQ